MGASWHRASNLNTERKRNVVLSFDHHFCDHKDAFARSRIPQATQVPAVR